MNRLEELRRVFGGHVRAIGDRRWLDTRVGGLRVFVIQRGRSGAITLDLAVFTPDTREFDPFAARTDAQEWVLEPTDALPSLSHGFVFAGCCGGVLFAIGVSPPLLEDVVAALWELGRWAREPWQPRDRERYGAEARAARRRVWRDRLVRAFTVVAVIVAIRWLRDR